MSKANDKILAFSKDRYSASAEERRRYGGSIVTEFYVMRAQDEEDASKWDVITGYGKTAPERKRYAIDEFRRKHGNPAEALSEEQWDVIILDEEALPEIVFDGPIAEARAEAILHGDITPIEDVYDVGTGAYMAIIDSGQPEIFHIDRDGFVYVVGYDNFDEALDDYTFLRSRFPMISNPKRSASKQRNPPTNAELDVAARSIRSCGKWLSKEALGLAAAWLDGVHDEKTAKALWKHFKQAARSEDVRLQQCFEKVAFEHATTNPGRVRNPSAPTDDRMLALARRLAQGG